VPFTAAVCKIGTPSCVTVTENGRYEIVVTNPPVRATVPDDASLGGAATTIVATTLATISTARHRRVPRTAER